MNSLQGPGLPGQKVKRRHEGRSVHASQQAPYESTASFSSGRALGQSAQYLPSRTSAAQAPAGQAGVPGRVARQGGWVGRRGHHRRCSKRRGRAGRVRTGRRRGALGRGAVGRRAWRRRLGDARSVCNARPHAVSASERVTAAADTAELLHVTAQEQPALRSHFARSPRRSMPARR